MNALADNYESDEALLDELETDPELDELEELDRLEEEAEADDV